MYHIFTEFLINILLIRHTLYLPTYVQTTTKLPRNPGTAVCFIITVKFPVKTLVKIHDCLQFPFFHKRNSLLKNIMNIRRISQKKCMKFCDIFRHLRTPHFLPTKSPLFSYPYKVWYDPYKGTKRGLCGDIMFEIITGFFFNLNTLTHTFSTY